MTGTGCVQAPAHRKLYVVNTSDDTLSVVDLEERRVTHEIRVGYRPFEVRLSPDGNRLYCTVQSTRRLLVIDPLKDEVLDRIPLPGVPHGLDVSPDGRYVYVALFDRGELAVVSPENRNVVRRLAVGRWTHNVVARSGSVYATSILDRRVRKFDEGGLVETYSFEAGVRPIVVDAEQRTLFAALEGLHGFTVLDLRTGKLAKRVERPLPPPERRSSVAYIPTHGLALRPGTRELWVTSFMGDSLMIFDVKTPAEPAYVAEVQVGEAPNNLSFSPDGGQAYSGNFGSHTVSIVDCAARTELAELSVGQGPKRALEVRLPWKVPLEELSRRDVILRPAQR